MNGNIMCRLKSKHVLSLLACIFILSGCKSAADGGINESDVAQALQEAGMTEQVNELAQLVTEDDFRNAIKALSSTADDIARKVEIYDEFAGKYELSEAEYIEYADLCAEIGDTKKQREVLWMLYRLDPTKEHGDLISERVLILDKAVDTEAFSLASQIHDSLMSIGTPDFDLSSATSVIMQESWIKSFVLDTGIFTSYSRVNDNGYTVDIYADQVTNTAIVVENSTAYGIKLSAIGCDVWKCDVSDNGYAGEYYIANYDELGNIISSSTGTIQNGHCVGEATFAVGDTVYKGTFDGNGLTQEAQLENVDGVVYAYDDSGKYYLYAAGSDATSWTADIEFLGMSKYEK